MKLFNRQPKFVYEFSDIDNFFDREIKNFNALVTLLEDENYRINAEGGTSHVTITKINARNDTIIFSQSFSLPCPEDTDFDSMCQSFMSKKPLPEMPPKDFKQLKADEPTPQSENTDDELPEESTLEVLQEIVNDDEPLSDEIESIILPEVETNSDNSDDEQLISEFQTHTEDISLPASSFDDEVSGLIDTFNQEMKSILADFVQKEKVKIADEISRLDKRSEIDKRITDEFEKQESTEKSLIAEAISTNREKAIEAENLRHDEALIEINNSFDNELSDKLTSLKDSYRIKIKDSISKQYAKETEVLSKIFQGKSAELSVRQKALNQGLQEKFTSSLNRFNETHQTVISQLKTFQE